MGRERGVPEAEQGGSRAGVPRLLLLCLAIALVLRLGAALTVGSAFRFNDEAVYTDAGARLLNGEGLDPQYTGVPGYPALLAMLSVLAPSGVLGLRLAQAAVTSLGCILCFGLARRLAGAGAGVAAAALYAVDPLLVVSSGLLYAEAMAALILAAAVIAAWEATRRDRLELAMGAGFLLGTLALFRPVGLVLAPVFLLWVWASAPGGRGRRAALVAAFGLTWGLSLLPWTLRNYKVHGRLIPVAVGGIGGVPALAAHPEQSGVAQALAAEAQREPGQFAARLAREFLGFWELYPTRLVTDNPTRREEMARADPRLTSNMLVQRNLRDIVGGLSFGLELALALLGAVSVWRLRRRETIWLLAMLLAFSLGYALLYGKTRYRIPLLPIVLAYAGVGAYRVAAGFRLPASRRAEAASGRA
jgi:4-amino-4-deoxy-L-arabinose transferase-like glycosyltransferase